MASAWIVDGPWIARNVKSASVSSALRIKDCGAYINCPKCSYQIDNNNVLTPSWPGLPKGVKFDPTDEDVIEHLQAKCGMDGIKPHLLIQDFISSLTQEVGINYTHPQNLPGVTMDGTSVFFFHKTAQAYQNGQRKRRKITPTGHESIRWHRTGQTKPVMLNGVQKGCKQIMVLYESATKEEKSKKTNWILHQYHLGTEEDEIGEFVVSKIMFQQQEKTITPTPRTPVISVSEGEPSYDDSNMALDPLVQGLEKIQQASFGLKSDKRAHVAVEFSVTEDNLLRKESEASSSSSFVEKNPINGNFNVGSESFSVSDLEIAYLPDFHSFDTEDSVLKSFGWLK